MTMPAPAAPHPAEAEAPVLPSTRQAPPSAIAFRLAQALGKAKADLIFIASSDRRAEQTAQALHSFAPHLDVFHFPAWDATRS